MDAVPELLAPAGGPPQFNAALAAGADAIYCGFGTTFNARRGAQSFDSNTFAEACRKAHVAGAQVYVTVNVVIRSDEMPSVLALVRRAWLLGADAFIIQDWGLLHEVRKRWPQISCHVSTQANVHDARGVAWCKHLGADRVTLSRELPMDEIQTIAREGVDLESFCHGAICICYSGICQMSSSAGDRSANRGACAQPCRLPYALVDRQGKSLSSAERGRPLCPKDFYSFDDLPELVQTGVRSLKVEGRLKGPEYLASVIAVYRAQLDDIASGRVPEDDDLAERRQRLKRAFNRDFTNAYLHGTSADDLMSYERSNNRGELVGTVVDARSYGSVKVHRGGRGGGRERLRTVRVAETDIALDKPVDKGDLLEIRPVSDPSQFLTANVTEDASEGQTITCRTTRAMPTGSLVRVIRSQRAMELGAQLAERAIPRKRAVRVHICARLGEPFAVELKTTDGVAKARVEGFVVENARTRAVTEKELIEHVGRMGNSVFEAMEFTVELDEGCGMGFSAVHAVRTQACESLERELLAPYNARQLNASPSRETIARELRQKGDTTSPRNAYTPEVCALVATPEAAARAHTAGATRIYAASDALLQGVWPQGVIPVLDEVCREIDHRRLDSLVRRGERVAVGNVSELALARDLGALPELRSCIPVHNESCLVMLQNEGAQGAWLSPELSLDEIAMLAQVASVPVGLMVLARTRVMTTEHCVLQVANACVHDCTRCGLRKKKLFLKNDAGDLFPVQTDLQGRSRVYAASPLDATPQIPDLMASGVCRFLADCTLLSPQQTQDAVCRVARAVEAALAGRQPAERKPGYNSGHLFAPIA